MGAAEIAAQLRASGKRMTTQREQVLELLETTPEPMDAAELHLLAQRYHPAMSLSTIYRNLQVLVDLGVVTTLDLGDGHTRYSLRRAHEAHHLVCDACHRVIEFDSPLVHQLCQALAAEHQFILKDLRLVLRGQCQGERHICRPDQLQTVEFT